MTGHCASEAASVAGAIGQLFTHTGSVSFLFSWYNHAIQLQQFMGSVLSSVSVDDKSP